MVATNDFEMLPTRNGVTGVTGSPASWRPQLMPWWSGRRGDEDGDTAVVVTHKVGDDLVQCEPLRGGRTGCRRRRNGPRVARLGWRGALARTARGEHRHSGSDQSDTEPSERPAAGVAHRSSVIFPVSAEPRRFKALATFLTPSMKTRAPHGRG